MRALQPGDQLEVTVEKIVPGGEGLGKVMGFPIFVPGGLPGDRGAVEMVSVKKEYGRGLMFERWEASPQRVQPPCPLSERCGGCQWQHFDYPAQLSTKRALLLESLARIGKLAPEPLEALTAPVLGMRDPWHYRNKGQFPVQQGPQGLEAGFYAPRSHDLVPVERCLLHPEALNQALNTTVRLLNAAGIPASDTTQRSGFLRHIILRQAFDSGHLLLGLVSRVWEHPALAQLVTELAREIPALVGIVQNYHPQPGNRILGFENRLLYGSATLSEQLGGLRFEISLPSFFQVNPPQTEVLYDTVKAMANLQGHEQVLDAFAGAGTIGIWLARHCRDVICLESVPEAIADGQRNAALNQLNNLRFIQGQVEGELPQLLAAQPPDCVILDPPRKGCEAAVLNALLEHPVARIVYISCNPATLARDLERLSSGYTPTRIQPVDLFPHTHHLETAVQLVKN